MNQGVLNRSSEDDEGLGAEVTSKSNTGDSFTSSGSTSGVPPMLSILGLTSVRRSQQESTVASVDFRPPLISRPFRLVFYYLLSYDSSSVPTIVHVWFGLTYPVWGSQMDCERPQLPFISRNLLTYLRKSEKEEITLVLVNMLDQQRRFAPSGGWPQRRKAPLPEATVAVRHRPHASAFLPTKVPLPDTSYQKRSSHPRVSSCIQLCQPRRLSTAATKLGPWRYNLLLQTKGHQVGKTES